MTQQLTRRDAIVGAAAAVAGAAGGLSVTQRVAATDSGEAELTINGTIPPGTSIDATIDEYDTSDSSAPINTQILTATSSGAQIFDGLEASGDYYYEFTLDWTGDGSATPELETPLVFEVPPPPPPEPEDFEYTDYTTSSEWSAKPDDAEIVWDEYRLRKYAPKLSMGDKTRDRFQGLYGYVATSESEDTDVLCYWSRVKRVESIDWIDDNKLGSALGDHDPIYVFVNSETDEIERIVYSTYHLGAAEVRPSEDELEQDRANEPTHATFTVVDRWHHFRHTPDATGHLNYDLKSWPAVRDTWQSNNFGPDSTAVENPWQLATANDWRANDDLFSLTDLWLNIGQTLGWFGSEDTDELRED